MAEKEATQIDPGETQETLKALRARFDEFRGRL